MKLLVLITFILFPILERAQTYELVNSTTTEEPKSHHLGFASVDLENEDESESGCEGYGCDNAPGYGALSPNYGPPTPSYGSPGPTYDEPIGSGADSMLNSVSILKILLLELWFKPPRLGLITTTGYFNSKWHTLKSKMTN